MPRRTSESTENSWAKGFVNQLQAQSETVPRGWRTCYDWSVLWDLGTDYTRALLIRGTRIGKMEMRKFRINTRGRVYPVPHYRIKDPQSRSRHPAAQK